MGNSMWNESDLTLNILQASEHIYSTDNWRVLLSKGRAKRWSCFSSQIESNILHILPTFFVVLTANTASLMVDLNTVISTYSQKLLKQWDAHPKAHGALLCFTNVRWMSLVPLHESEIKLKTLSIWIFWLSCCILSHHFLIILAVVSRFGSDRWYSTKSETGTNKMAFDFNRARLSVAPSILSTPPSDFLVESTTRAITSL